MDKKGINVLAQLQDLTPELQEIAIGKEGCFYQYKNKSSLARNIYNDFSKYNFKKTGKNNEFVLSDDISSSGIISQLQGLLVMLSLKADMDLSSKKFTSEDIDAILDDIFEKTKSKAGGGYRIDASPYLVGDEHFDKYAYMDTLTWLISAILAIAREYINGSYELTDERKAKLVDLYKWSLNYVCNSFVDAGEGAQFRYGWNFTKDCEEPSLFFTFAVSELLIDALGTFENVIRTADIDLVSKSIYEALDKDKFFDSERYKARKDDVLKALEDANVDEDAGYENALARFNFAQEEKILIAEVYDKLQAVKGECYSFSEKYNSNTDEVAREIELFKLFNDNNDVYAEKSPYARLEEMVKLSAGCIWDIVKDDVSNTFFSADLKTKISENIIENSVSSDAVFNVLFIINILINAGYDEDFDDKILYFTFNGSDEYYEAIEKYDHLRDSIRLAFDNCFQFYSKLKKLDKEYKINRFTLNFDEKFVVHNDFAKLLRKTHIKEFSLMPLLSRTKATINEFLIRYPQYDMQIFLEQILMNRYKDGDNYLWMWEKDGYSSIDNYYYLYSLVGFYNYYEEYEDKFRLNANNNKIAKEKIERDYHKQLREDGKAVDKYLAEFEELENLNASLKEEIEKLNVIIAEYKSDPLRSALEGMVTKVIKEHVISILADKMSVIATDIISGAKERIIEKTDGTSVSIEDWNRLEKARVENASFEQGFSDLSLAIISDRLGESIYSSYSTKEEREKELNNLPKYMRQTEKDIKQALRYYLLGIAQGQQKSNYVANKGQSVFDGPEHRLLVELLESKKSKGDK